MQSNYAMLFDTNQRPIEVSLGQAILFMGAGGEREHHQGLSKEENTHRWVIDFMIPKNDVLSKSDQKKY